MQAIRTSTAPDTRASDSDLDLCVAYDAQRLDRSVGQAFRRSRSIILLPINLLSLLALDLVRVLGVVLLVDVVVGLVEVGLVADALGRVRLGEVVNLLDLVLGEGDDWVVSR